MLSNSLPVSAETLEIGWASSDLTPKGAVAMRGGVLSEGVRDPITATALALAPDGGVDSIEVHAIRIGEAAMTTNPFDLYLDHGARIKGRSPAVQTFVVQLAGSGTYLPTARAVAGSAYGAISRTCLVGPAAGEAIVETTLEMLTEFWAVSSVENR